MDEELERLRELSVRAEEYFLQDDWRADELVEAHENIRESINALRELHDLDEEGVLADVYED